MDSHSTKKNDYSHCVILVFNQNSSSNLTIQDKAIMQGLKDKWMMEHPDDTKGDRIHIVHVGAEDFKFNDLSENPKFKDIKDIDSNSHVYIVGHHYIEESDAIKEKGNHPNYFISSDGEAGQGRIDFPLSEVSRILLECIKNPLVNRNRADFNSNNTKPLDNTMQKLKISLVLCDSATGIREKIPTGKNPPLDYKVRRSYEDTLAFHFLYSLSNSNEKKLLDCVVTGIIGYVIPTPNNKTGVHKEYMGRRFNPVSGDVTVSEYRYERPLKREDAIKAVNSKSPGKAWKVWYEASPDTTSQEIKACKIKIVHKNDPKWEERNKKENEIDTPKPK